MHPLPTLLAPLSRPEQSALLRALSDLESGSPRQWLLLEIAATLGPAQGSRRTWLLTRLADWLGTPALLSVLECLQLPGLDIYRDNARLLERSVRQALDDATLLLVSFSALLAGFDRLPATSQFAACLLLLAGGAIKLWREYRRHPIAAEPDITGEEILPGAEAALGLQGLLLNKGITPTEAIHLLANLRHDPASALPTLRATLPELAPPHPARKEHLYATLVGWCLPIVPALWLNGWTWGWVLTVLWTLGLAWLVHHNRRLPALILALAVLAWALARIAHVL